MRDKEDQAKLEAMAFQCNTFSIPRRYFIANEIITINQIKKYTRNALFKIKEDDNFEIWYSQLAQIYWDDNGNIYTPNLITKSKKYTLTTFDLDYLTLLENSKIKNDINDFELECKGEKIKVHAREGLYYRLAYLKKDEVRIKQIIEEFRNKNYSAISGTCAQGNIFDLEVID